jgi:hypothetical protein
LPKEFVVAIVAAFSVLPLQKFPRKVGYKNTTTFSCQEELLTKNSFTGKTGSRILTRRPGATPAVKPVQRHAGRPGLDPGSGIRDFIFIVMTGFADRVVSVMTPRQKTGWRLRLNRSTINGGS